MRRASLLVLGAIPLFAAACGGGGDDDVAMPNDDGIVEVTMEDIRFDPDDVEVERGATVTFRFRNDGELTHEAFVGTEAEQMAHEAEMNPRSDEHEDAPGHDATATMPDEPEEKPGGEHMDESAVTVDPGDSASIEYTFDESGTFEVGCHEPGHYEAGMKMTVRVV